MLSGVHSRHDVATVTSGSDQPDPDHVPTSWFLTTSPVCAAIRPVAGAAARPPLRAISLRVAGLLHPAANRGVHRVSGPGSPVARCRRHSRDAFLPLEGFSPSSAVPCHHGLLPSCRSLAALLEPPGFALPLPPFNPHRAVSVDFKALLRGWVCTTVRRFRPPMACPPVGFCFPSKVLRSRASACAVDRDERASRLRGQSRRSSRCTLQWALLPRLPGPPCGGSDARCSGVPLPCTLPRV